ncbi:hypothetical protein BJF92_23145 [Rhizobium rhizosphaerae]|uniref:Uncharacterized protein n=1 Tax=Xaviernesmea rhizosphaerae TaxID=1672749 RepID=A0A1Q9AJU3_9HYPH|nr:hypothetical protein [Xaviernesmea rhizosphaerae]OLP55507.1 hypothetical protein BJF92_23145 [Xaviernesmea rhizosphaerae]OQP85613.1 hypothetical protein BTR14_15245 [Xaviernesmea rhizosphaerae]
MPHPDLALMIAAFDRLAAAGFVTGSHWAAVHDVCQAHEGEAAFDWGHALCHRIEGDDWNAGYWYRRAGKPKPSGTFDEEWAAMRAALAADAG